MRDGFSLWFNAYVMRLSPLVPMLLGIAVYGLTLRFGEFIQDDFVIVEQNPIVWASGQSMSVWTSGYWGPGATISEYRPLALASFRIQSAWSAHSAQAFRAVNLFLHGLICLLLVLLLRRFMPERQAWLAAVFFAVLPVHAEAVVPIVSRSELLADVFLLLAWLALDGPESAAKIVLGSGAFALALLSKEHTVMFPALLAASDWTFRGTLPWSAERRSTYGALSAVAAAYLALRELVLKAVMNGGFPYFHGVPWWSKWLTLARFWVDRYAWSSITGLALANDFSRPLIADSSLGDLWGWLCLAAVGGLVIAAGWNLAVRRSRWAFWTLLAVLFLLPTAHLFFQLDTIGAQRFLYIPSISVAVAFAYLFDGVPHPRFRQVSLSAAGCLAAVFFVLTARRSNVWAGKLEYYEDAIRQNPVSTGAHLGYGMALLDRGDRAGAKRELEEAIRLKPSSAVPFYDLGRLAWEDGDRTLAESLFRKSLLRNPNSSSTLDFLGLISQSRKDYPTAERCYRTALGIQPLDKIALFNLGELLYRSDRQDQGTVYFERFLSAYPDDPDAEAVRRLLGSVKSSRGRRPS